MMRSMAAGSRGKVGGMVLGGPNRPGESQGNGFAATPIVSLRLSVNDVPVSLWLKLEGYAPHGSIKGRVAQALWQDISSRIGPRTEIIESTSGNLGLALASLAARHRVPFTAVVDPRSSGAVVAAIQSLGGRTVTVDTPDGAGGYLLTRLGYIQERLRDQPGMLWPNQYANPANPRAHALGTAPELRTQLPRRPTSVLVAVSTGGTLAGFRDYVTAARPDWELIGVDVVGSAALGGRRGPRLLPGIGASRQSAFLPQGYRPALRVAPAEAVSACVWLRESTGIGVGASSGALVAVALRLFRAAPHRGSVTCLCPDGAEHYLGTVFSARWRERLPVVDVARGVEVTAVESPRFDTLPGPVGLHEGRVVP
ncbi:pyridoxal-phosphate dependent enzyme [Streptomyces sp. HUCO-GS316]|uniref:pyridoxal-phosphate dependent enzyme n=1 Tax=Streptomyces sp. HUCO-GS316 TaxID=2692198 RepID=UPI00301D792B